ncbi:uncharacterized protein LOC119985503 [Tripterygium wilfordii]|uniref:uncharacterized protein LOC119985503 n=1 Tax=Tripterygium wilfordii TaxID=458696 RepID=UPI0018F82006|nr:uncharacterized protein LOC119985503 [Tripterygium wilfordii]
MQIIDLTKGSQTIDEFLHLAKSLSNSLASISAPISNKDLVLAVLRGLGADYMMLRTTILNTPPLPDFLELRSRILTFESTNQCPSMTPSSDQALLVTHRANHSGRWGRRNGYGGGYNHQQQLSHTPPSWNQYPNQQSGNWRETRPNSTPGILGPPWCPTCNTNQHSQAQCPHRYHGPNTFSPFAGYMQSDLTWYTNTGATNHMTS